MNQTDNQYKDAEKRTCGTIEVREAEGDEMILEGYASVFNQETDLGHFREVIKPGAFDNVLDNDVRALINHDPNLVLGRTTNGTLELSVDERGLKYRVKLGNQTYARDFYESVKRGDINQSSFAFTIDEQSWNEERTLRSVDKVRTLLDVSPVTYPAYSQASVMARDQQPEIETTPEVAPDTETPEIQKTMNLNEMKAVRAKHADRFEELVNIAESENRDWTNGEQEEADLCKREVERLDGKISRRQAHEDMIARQAQMGGKSVSEAKEINKINRSFSLSRAIESASFGKALEGAEAEWAQEASKEFQARGLNMSGQIGIPAHALYRALGDADEFSATTGAGSGFVATAVPGAIEALRTPTMAERIGITTINNATSNLQFPRVSTKATGTAEGEADANADSGLDMDEVTLTPNRVSAKTLWSKQLILQGGAGIDALISSELSAGINETIDKAVFAAAVAGAADQDQVAGAIGYSNITDAEKAVLAAGGDLSRCAFVGSPSAMSILKGEAAVASIRAVVDGNNVDGFTTYFTPNLIDATGSGTPGALLFGDYAQGMLLAFFGGVDLLVDPYSNAGTAQIALHVNKFYDTAVRQGGALSYVYDFS
jgi:HK97 family phage prohead protease/HK97 family phage major capsid protein